SIDICWVPGHTGVPGNELADREAKRAIIEGSSTQELLPRCLVHPLPATKPVLCAYHRAQISTIIATSWHASPRYYCVNRHLPEPSLKRLRRIIPMLPRKLLMVLVYLITDHNPLCSHLHCIGKATDKLCSSCCHSPETTDHYLLHCQTHNAARLTLAMQCSIPVCHLTLKAFFSHPKRLAALFRCVNDTA
ncbi:hypothetical protein BDQ17DRAFT_1241445, partial [Cyathus striatus]